MTAKEIEKRLDRLEGKLKTAREIQSNVLQNYQNQIDSIRKTLEKMMAEGEGVKRTPLDYPVSPMDAFSKDKYFFSKVTNQPDPIEEHREKAFKEAKPSKIQPITTDNATIHSSFDRGPSSDLVAKEGYRFIIDEDYSIKVKKYRY